MTLFTSSETNSTQRKRILVWGLSNNLAGTEGVIRNIASACSDQMSFDFITTEDVPNHYDLVNLNNNRLFVLPKLANFSNNFRRAISDHFTVHSPEYSAVWSNLCDARNIEVLKLAYKYKVPRRILHSHSSSLDAPPHAIFLSNLRKKIIIPKLTDYWACSKKAGHYMFGDHPFDIIPNAISFSQYAFNARRRFQIRQILQIPQDSFVIGYIGRLVKSKNHEFILNLMASDPRLNNAHFVIVGNGVMKDNLIHQTNELKMTDRIHFIEPSKDVAAFYSCFDVFAFPSLFEGLPLVLLEAQANGLPVIMSSAISEEGIISNSVSRIPLNDRKKWTTSILQSDRSLFQLTPSAQKFDLDRQIEFFKNVFLTKEIN